MFGRELLNRGLPLSLGGLLFFGESATSARRKHHSQSRKQAVERRTAVEKKRFVGTLEEKTAVKCPIAWAFP